MSNIFAKYKNRYDSKQAERLTIESYLEKCKTDKSYYANIFERLLKAIGNPSIVDSSKDDRLSRIHSNNKIREYAAFNGFYSIENCIAQIIAFLKAAASSMEESKNILYFLGPVGSAKSSLAELMKYLTERLPIYSIEAFNVTRNKFEISPIYESPLGLFDFNDDAENLEKEYHIPKRYLKYPMSPWAVKRLREASGDISTFKVVKVWPSVLNQIGITKVEPGDENNQDISALVGKVNIRELGEDFNQSDPDAYNWVGGLNVTTQGVLDYVEMFKSNLKTLGPLLTATQEGHYNGTEQFGAIPYQGLIIAHSNEAEWISFKNDNKNEAFLDRITIIKVPYCLRVSDEVKIYKKLLDGSELKKAIIAPGTLEMLAEYSVSTRVKEHENSSLYTKMQVYDGKNMKNKDPNCKSLEEYKEMAGIDEGMSGSSTRFAYKILSKVFHYDQEEIAANPIHLMLVLEKQLIQESLPKDEETKRLTFINEVLKPKYIEFLEKEIQQAYVENASDYMQNIFERYISVANAWIREIDYRDQDTNELYDRETLNNELEKIEKPAGIANPKEFRNDVVNFVLRAQVDNAGKMIKWNTYEKIREVIEKNVFKSMENLLPVISFSKKASEEDQKKHNAFLKRLEEKGYTQRQVRLAVDWLIRVQKHS